MSRPLASAAALSLSLALALPLAAQKPAAPKSATSAKAAPATLASVDPALFNGLRYRMIGPARGGRVTAITGVPSEPRTFYMGSTGGGIWKTTDAGANWVNISDGQLPVGSMGAIEVAPSDSRIVFAGTGSSKIRSNVSIGRGMYKSVDAGKTWRFSGLRDVGQIATIRVDPRNADVAFAATLGNPFIANPERGVYKTTDGGKSWKNVLFVTDSTGAADLELQPGNPDVVFASMWHGMRHPWTIVSGAQGEGGIYKSSDGGNSWTKLGGGLPTGLFGRSNVAISAAAPNRIYALIEAKPGGGLYRSDDAGDSWTYVNGAQTLWTRPFYYTTLQVDPKNPDVVYVGNEGWFKSTDGGKTFKSERVPHGDNHDLWINPNDPRIMLQSNDGGANVSLNGGRTWSTQYNQPTGQSEEWRTGPGCETGPILPNAKNPNVVYGSCKGQFSRMNLVSGDEQQYWVGGESLYGNGGNTLIYRFQRVSPMALSPFDPKVIYYGSQYLHRTRDEGVTWQKISPDLTAFPPGAPQEPSGTPITRDATGEEVYSTLYAIRESPVQKGLIWTGSNDGLVQVTRDDGKSWTNVTPKGLPPGGRVQNIEPSPHRAGTAYVAIYRFLLGDFAPYLYRTDDFGKTWTRLTDGTNGIAADEPTRVVREDPLRPKLLYAGTEFGMHVSFDDGAHWQSLQLNLPATPVTDIVVHAKDLVLSTQGRAFWILDNVTPLHQLTDKLVAAEAVLYAPRTATRMKIRPSGGMGRGVAAQYPASGAQIDYYLAQAPAGDITLTLLDAAGKTIRTFTSAGAGATAPTTAEADDEESFPRRPSAPPRLDKRPGMHRFTWDLRYPGPWQSERVPEGGNGPMAVPGTYQVKLTVGAWSDTKRFTVVEDPRVTADGVTLADLQAQFAHNMKVRDLVSESNHAVARIRAAQQQYRSDAAMLGKVNAIGAKLITPPVRYSQPELATHVTYLYSMTTGADQKVGNDAKERLVVLRKQLDVIAQQINSLLGPRM
ncbi:MAG: hypothetical protein HY084_06135 [Gemmatimonadetes bacterium]|nr:hypothetical protein [Gemmatimonadota bacterium]